MGTFKERLIDEKQQLDEKIQKLGTFIKGEHFSGIEKVQQSLLKTQHAIMVSYSDVLSERLTWLDSES